MCRLIFILVLFVVCPTLAGLVSVTTAPSAARAEAVADESTTKIADAVPDKNGSAATPVDTGHVLEFNGFDSDIEVSHIPFDTFDGFTIEAWVRGWSTRVAYQGKEGDPENSVWLTWGSPGWSIGWESDHGQDYRYKLESLAADRWEHIALVFDGTKQYVFVEGKKAHEMAAPKPGPLVKDRKLLVGAQENFDDTTPEKAVRNATGFLAALRISSKALYTKPFTPPAGFTADKSTELLYDMSRKDDKLLHDLSAKKRDGALHNVLWVPRSQVK